MPGLLKKLLLSISLFSLWQCHADLIPCPTSTDGDYDFVVVGAGAGGGPIASRLAESGFTVLVIDAGHDVDNVNSTIPLYFIRAIEDLQMELNYTLDEYPPGFRFQKNDAWYPRAQGVGGSAVHNALIHVIGNTKMDFDTLASMFSDPTWSRDNMQEYYKKLEHNLYTIPPSSDHGYDGWLKTSVNPNSTVLNPKFLDAQLVGLVGAITASGPPGLPVLDLNALASDQALGLAQPTFTIDENHNRSSVRNRLLAVEQDSSSDLTISTNTLATKILLCNNSAGIPTAYGVEIAPGASLPIAADFNGKSALETQNITVRREVIVSAGVFQSPQLLMLSGIGNGSHLREFGIEPIVDLPGVGNNLQDHDEIATIWRMRQNFSLSRGCEFLPDLAQDPCLEYWQDNERLNLYSFGGALQISTSQSTGSPEPDMFTYWNPSYFPGFVRGFSQELVDNHNAVTVVNLKAHPSSKGTVRLTGSHPQDLLDIQKLRFQAENGPQDVADLREAIKRARTVMQSPLISSFVLEEIFPGPQAQTDEQIDDHVYQNIFGHHACCTNPIGSDDDENAVLDGDFRVRGVNNLRVVDASSWPNVPGYFITTPIYMVSEKAADVMIQAAKNKSSKLQPAFLLQI